jgi:hypothetical protein
MPRKKPERKYMKSTDGRKNNGQKRGDAILRRSLSTPTKINKAMKVRSKLLATKAIKDVYGSEEEFWVMVAENAKNSQFDRKMIAEYVYGKPGENLDITKGAENVDISIMNFFQGTPQIEEDNTIDIDEDTEAE